MTGTAADTGGRVGAVEVSVDGGASWHPASGRETWSYSWTPTDPGATTLLSRAADDSANLGTPSQVTVNVPAKTCPCTLFGDAVPAKTASDVTPVELGLRFSADADGEIRALRYYSPGGSGVRLGHLWNADGTQQLAEVTFPAGQGWHEVALATPVPVTSGTRPTSRPSMRQTARTPTPTNFFAAAYDAAPLHAPASGNGDVCLQERRQASPTRSATRRPTTSQTWPSWATTGRRLASRLFRRRTGRRALIPAPL